MTTSTLYMTGTLRPVCGGRKPRITRGRPTEAALAALYSALREANGMTGAELERAYRLAGGDYKTADSILSSLEARGLLVYEDCDVQPSLFGGNADGMTRYYALVEP